MSLIWDLWEKREEKRYASEERYATALFLWEKRERIPLHCSGIVEIYYALFCKRALPRISLSSPPWKILSIQITWSAHHLSISHQITPFINWRNFWRVGETRTRNDFGFPIHLYIPTLVLLGNWTIVGRKGERRKEIEGKGRRIFEKAFELLPTIYHLAIRSRGITRTLWECSY